MAVHGVPLGEPIDCFVRDARTFIWLLERAFEVKKDFLLNILASLVSVGSIQLICYPMLSKIMSPSEYGVLLTLMGFSNLVVVVLGNSLNNARLIRDQSYREARVAGDFNPLVIVCSIISLIILAGVAAFFKYDLFNAVLVGIATALTVWSAYHQVSFRLTINYIKNLAFNVLRAVGYAIGSVVACRLGYWQVSFVIGEVVGCIYLLFCARTVSEPYVCTSLFSATFRDFSFVSWGNVANGVMTYVDRFLLLPLLGATSVAYYTVASYLGKSAGILINPVSSVLLTYFVKDKDKVDRRIFHKRLFIVAVMSSAMLLFVLLIARPTLSILYPDLVSGALPYVLPASIAATLGVVSGTIQPMVLAYAPAYWQTIIQIGYLLIFGFFGLFGISAAGLTGFCFALIAANSARALLMICVTEIALKA